jgi:hypothetical protein
MPKKKKKKINWEENPTDFKPSKRFRDYNFTPQCPDNQGPHGGEERSRLCQARKDIREATSQYHK